MTKKHGQKKHNKHTEPIDPKITRSKIEIIEVETMKQSDSEIHEGKGRKVSFDLTKNRAIVLPSKKKINIVIKQRESQYQTIDISHFSILKLRNLASPLYSFDKCKLKPALKNSFISHIVV